ncbi:MAG: LacI family DNA-binding transcriptional regulator [Rhodobacteraceae bacterium]|nr:LacI family DNA-binding transcriptional regulator [Paracoccaceae bacterium]
MADNSTFIQIAARARVGQAAVSRVFTPNAVLSVKTTEQMPQAARELGYRPNVPRSLTTGKSRLMGPTVAYLETCLYPEVLEKLSSALQYQGYRVLTFMASHKAGKYCKY